MAREIKFKIWDKDNNVLVRTNLIDLKNKKKSFILLQFTGMKDHNGLEIFEDDVLMLHQRKYTVVWDSSRGGWGMKDNDSILVLPLVPEKADEVTRMYNKHENHKPIANKS